MENTLKDASTRYLRTNPSLPIITALSSSIRRGF